MTYTTHYLTGCGGTQIIMIKWLHPVSLHDTEVSVRWTTQTYQPSPLLRVCTLNMKTKWLLIHQQECKLSSLLPVPTYMSHTGSHKCHHVDISQDSHYIHQCPQCMCYHGNHTYTYSGNHRQQTCMWLGCGRAATHNCQLLHSTLLEKQC